MAAEYNLSVQTFRNKLRQNGINLPPGSIMPKWQKVIYERLGYPAGVNKEHYKDV